MCELLEEACSTVRRSPAGPERRIESSCSAGLEIVTDPALLRHVLLLLLRNAVEASALEQVVGVEALVAGDGRVEIRISNPQVMSERERELVFKRDFSTKAETGRGLGCHAARLFAEKYLRGRIAFTSASPAGTTFTVSLPRRTG